MLIDISKIKVQDRIRKDFGNIDELAQDIKENSLLNPITVIPIENGEYQLVAGERRLRACKSLGYTNVIVNTVSVKDAEQALRMEISENENRKEFTFSERMDYAKRLEQVERVKARERQKVTQFGNTVQETFPEPENKQTRDIVAEATGFGSGKQYEKAKFISDNADEEMIAALDEGKLSINKAFITLKQQKEILERQLQTERSKPAKVIDNTDYSTISQLKEDLNKKIKEMEFLKRDKDILERKVKLNEEDSKKYNDLKKQIDDLTHTREDIKRQIDAAISISGLVVEINNLIKTKLAPIQYSKAILEAKDDKIVIQNLTDIIEVVESWCTDMRKNLPNNNIITVEVIK